MKMMGSIPTLLLLLLSGQAIAQDTARMGNLLQQGYQITSSIPTQIGMLFILQKGGSAFVCDWAREKIVRFSGVLCVVIPPFKPN